MDVYCDGASRKDGRGGWGFAVYVASRQGDTEIAYDFGGTYNTSSNRMELKAAIMAVRWLPVGAAATLHSDSKYVIDGILEHMDIWLRTGWRSSSNQAVKNVDLWVELANLDVDRVLSWQWVKGHSGVVGNERADELAGLGVPKEVKETK